MKRLFIVFMMMVTGLCLADKQADITEWVAKGDAAFAEFDNKKALEWYEKAWALEPGNVDLLTRLTWTCNNVGEDLASKESETYFEKAIFYAEKLKRAAPEKAETWFLISISHGNLGLFQGGKKKVAGARAVVEAAQKCVELDPDYGPGYVALGIYYREVAGVNAFLRAFANRFYGGLPTGTLEDAETFFLKGISKDPESLYAYYQLAKTYEDMEKTKKAVYCYRKVLAFPVTEHQDAAFKKVAAERVKKLEKND
ncbi:MAG: hypothetical protein RRC34_02975 [Lentisphaeria bacterium]|nr:hypothetical protein [Lentisphaeria bacterium]